MAIFSCKRYIKKLCPSVWTLLVPKVDALLAVRSKYIIVDFYFYFLVPDPNYSGSFKEIGFKEDLKTHAEGRYHMSHIKPPHAQEWPPHP